MPNHNYIDLTGKHFGRWIALRRDSSRILKLSRRSSIIQGRKTHPVIMWLCHCMCGVERLVEGALLRNGGSRSCGCLRASILSKRATTHGQSRDRRTLKTWAGTPIYEMLRGARQRAKKYKLPCNLTLDDIVVPRICPVFGVKLVASKGGLPKHNSPSLDRIIPARGYVVGNVCVISHRANMLKRDGSIEELQKVLRYMRRTAR